MRNKEEIKRLEQDRKEFDQYFRPDGDLRTISGGAELREIQSFLHDILNVVHWNLPTDNAGIERTLRKAATDGRLVPVVNHRHGALGRASRPAPAPLGWPRTSDGGGLVRSAYLFPPGTTSFEGEPVLSGAYDPAVQAARLAEARAGSSGGRDWLGVVEAVAGAALGGVPGEDETVDEGGAALADESCDTSHPLGDARPFEYGDDMLSGDSTSFDLAATPNTADPGWYLNPGSAQMRLFGNDGNPVVDFDFDHDHGQGIPHAHNWDSVPGAKYPVRGPGVSFSPL